MYSTETSSSSTHTMAMIALGIRSNCSQQTRIRFRYDLWLPCNKNTITIMVNECKYHHLAIKSCTCCPTGDLMWHADQLDQVTHLWVIGKELNKQSNRITHRTSRKNVDNNAYDDDDYNHDNDNDSDNDIILIITIITIIMRMITIMKMIMMAVMVVVTLFSNIIHEQNTSNTNMTNKAYQGYCKHILC